VADSTLDPQLIQQILMMQDQENDPAAQRISRQQKMIEGMRGSALKNVQGQMVGDRYVGPTATSAALNALGVLGGRFREGQMDTQMQQMNVDRAGAKGKYMQALIKAMRAQGMSPPSEQMPPDEFETDPAMGP
jgi:hypothetical protein